MSHTPTPWKVGEDESNPEMITGPTNDDGSFNYVAEIFYSKSPYDMTPTEKANAEFIVRACNAYDDMLAALKKFWEGGDTDDEELYATVRKAIEKAEGCP